MKQQVAMWVCGGAVVLLAAVAIRAEDPKKDKPATPPQGQQGQPGEQGRPEMTPEQMAEMQAMIEAGTPGPEHQRLAKLEGNWKTETKMWQDKDAPAEVYPGTATYKMIMGGRYLEEQFKSEWEGMPFEGRSICGYDNTKKKYFATWFDSMSTGMMVMEGTYDPAAKTTSFSGEFACPIEKGMKTMRMIEKDISDSKRVAEFYMAGRDGKEYKAMEITYTR
jgi:hypothetical protein